MSGLKWTGGTSPEKFAAALNSKVNRLVTEARELLVEETQNGVEMMQMTIVNSVTPTGEARGNPKGRIDTGNMYNEVDSAIIDHSETHIEGQFGWLDPEKYFDYQENGTEHIEPMHALAQAENQVFDEVKAGLVKIMRNLSK